MILGWLVATCARRRWPVAALAALLALGSVWAVRTRLGVSTDTGALFPSSLPWKQRAAVLQRAFPQNEELLVAVIDARQPEAATLTARDLAAALRADKVHFSEARQPDASPYLERNAFLFLDAGKLRDLLDRTIDAQPFLGSLAADPTLRGLCAALSLLAQGVNAGQVDLTPFLPALEGLRDGLAAAASGKPVALSWQRLLAGPVADLAGRFEFVLAKPNQDFGALEPGAAASQAIRDAASRLEFVRDGSARVRITGSVALNDEEFATVAQGAVAGLIGSAVLVTLWLFLAVRTWRAVVPILLTVQLGLLLTSGFAALAVGTLNLVSIAFAILFVGIAVDFSIQFSVRLRDAALGSPDLVTALARTGQRAGVQILVAALATAAGFLAFTPTDFRGVAQLGLIAGIGMLIAFVCTLTFLPALLALFRPAGGADEVGLRMAAPLDGLLVRARWPVVAAFAVLGVSGVILLPSLTFDSDPLHTKNRDTEAMRTLSDLMDDPVTNPYTMELLAPDLASAGALAARLAKLQDVDSVLWLRSFVPEDQDRKLAMIADAADLLDVTLAPPAQIAPVTADALRNAVRTTAAKLTDVVPRLPAGSPLVQIAAALTRLQVAPDATLLAVNTAMTRFLPMQLDRLRLALTAVRTTEADVPPEIRRDWMTPDGRAHVQVIPRASVRGSAALHKFVAQVQTVDPDAVGSAVTIVRSADTIVAAFRIAALSAVAAITLILALVLRRAVDVALVLAPLLLSSLLTVCAAVLLPLPLNFANIIALPLLLGVGVSFNIYFVMNWRAGQTHPLGSATARAVVFSALSTATAFGSLALSHHPGTASMGRLLLLSLGCTLATTMVFLPALLAVVPAGGEGGGGAVGRL
jgi:hopanoid biosynthesis associated RND transporter like protein HpnN